MAKVRVKVRVRVRARVRVRVRHVKRPSNRSFAGDAM